MSINIFLVGITLLCVTSYLNDPQNCSEWIRIQAWANNSSLYPNSPKFGPNTYRTPHQQLVLRLLQRPWSLQILSVEPFFLTGVEQLQRHLVNKLNVTTVIWQGNILIFLAVLCCSCLGLHWPACSSLPWLVLVLFYALSVQCSIKAIESFKERRGV